VIGELGGLGSAACWALVSTVMRSLSNHINPVMVNALRCGFAALTVAASLLLLGHIELLMAIPPANAALIVASGMIGQGLGDASFVTSMKSIGASRAMPVSSVQPLIATFLAVVILGERVTWLQIGGTLLVLAAVYLLAFPRGPLGQVGNLLGSADRTGLLLAICAAVCWSTSTIILKQGLEGVDMLSANFIRMAVAFVMLMSFQAFTSRRGVLDGVDRRALVVFAVAGVLGTLSSQGYLVAVYYAGAAKASVLTSTSPLFGLPLSIFVLHEKVNQRIAIGSLLCVAGIWLVLLG
jgi:drug/metabolite transporter (DMT)-like permease